MRPLARPSNIRKTSRVGQGVSALQRRDRKAGTGAAADVEWMYPTAVNFPLFGQDAVTLLASNWDRVDVAPATAVPYNAVYNNYQDDIPTGSSRTATDGDYFVRGCRLGPKGAQFMFQLGYLQGSDYGTMSAEVATLVENTDGSLENVSTVTWLDMVEGVSGYNASSRSVTTSYLWSMQINGDPGEQATTYTPGSGGIGQIDGGPGIYLFKFKVDGKHASSSGYKFALWELTLVRLTENDTDAIG